MTLTVTSVLMRYPRGWQSDVRLLSM
jgi:hypothetical protein